MRGRLAFAAALSLAGLASPARADKDPPPAPTMAIEEKNLVSGKYKIDPAQGYIFLRTDGRSNGAFVRIPDEQDLADYTAVFERSFAKAVKTYESQAAGYEKAVTFAQQRNLIVPLKPVKPERETYSVGDIGQRTLVNVGPMYAFSKNAATDEYSYLQQVKPGTYIYYGPVFVGANGVGSGVCFCMGSVRFEVKAGQITDLGDFLSVAPDQTAQVPSDMDPKLVSRLHGPGTPRYGLPASLAAYPSARAEFHASGKLNNFYGLMVSRMQPVPGVLAYQRDVAIDVVSGERVVLGFPRPMPGAAAAPNSGGGQP